MYVWNDENDRPVTEMVISHIDGQEYPYIVESWIKCRYIGYKHAKPIEPMELTMQEIADKFGVDVNNLKIKK